LMLVIPCCCRWSTAGGMYGLCIAQFVIHLDTCGLHCMEAGRLSCSTRWQVSALRHHICSAYPQLYIACKLMLLLFLPFSLNFWDFKDLGPLWILVLLVLVGSHTQDFLQLLLICS
jgi:hypothetical protein